MNNSQKYLVHIYSAHQNVCCSTWRICKELDSPMHDNDKLWQRQLDNYAAEYFFAGCIWNISLCKDVCKGFRCIKGDTTTIIIFGSDDSNIYSCVKELPHTAKKNDASFGRYRSSKVMYGSCHSEMPLWSQTSYFLFHIFKVEFKQQLLTLKPMPLLGHINSFNMLGNSITENKRHIKWKKQRNDEDHVAIWY